MKITRIATICLTLLLLWTASVQAADAPLMTLKLDVTRDTSYSVKLGDTAGELIVNLTRPPKDALSQVEAQVGEHLVAVKVMGRSATHLKLKLIVKPVIFTFSHGRQIDPHRINIDILPANAQSGLANVPSVPPLPMWDMLNEGSIILPPADYEAIDTERGDFTAYLAAVKLYRIGAWAAAEKRLAETLKDAANPAWAMSMVLYADVMFNQAQEGAVSWERVQRSLLLAERECELDFFKGRSALMAGYAYREGGLFKEAQSTFTRGANQYKKMADYFLAGAAQAALDLDENETAAELAALLDSRQDLDTPLKQKSCFISTLLTLASGDIVAANRQADVCLKGKDPIADLTPGQMLVVAEARLMGYRWGDAKRILDDVVRNFPDNDLAPLAALRQADVLDYERKHTQAIEAYETAARRWPSSPYARLAQLKADELKRFQLRDGNVADVWTVLDLHHEPALVSREARLRLMWLYEAMGRKHTSYGYLVELIRRYDGLRYWPFATRRFQDLTLDAYRQLTRENDFVGVVNLYTAEIDLPLDHAAKDEIAELTAHAYSRLGYWDNVVAVYLKALDREGRPVEGERELLMGLTRAYITNGDLYRAEKTQQYYRSRFTTARDKRDYWYMRGEIAQRQDDNDGALEAFQQAMSFESSPTEKRMLGILIGRVFYKRKDYPKAVDALAAALSRHLDPNVTIEANIIGASVRNGMYFLADSLTQLERWDAAYKVWSRCVELFPNDTRTPIARYYMARALIRLGRFDEAIEQYEALKGEDGGWKQIGELHVEISRWFIKHDLENLM